MNLTNSQEKAVSRLLTAYIDKEQPTVSFKAPTGSGKTFISSHLLSRIFDYEKQQGNKKTIIVIATISDAKLPLAFSKKIEIYKKYLPFRDFIVEHRDSPSNSKDTKIESVPPFSLENNKVLIFGTSSFGKNKLFNEQGILDDFLFEAKNQGWNLIYIRDEAHKGGAKASITKEKEYKKNFDEKLSSASSFSLQMTATPKGDYPVYELKESELNEDGRYLLKTSPIINPFDRNITGMEDVLEEAITKFKETKNEYSKLNKYIRPAMLIQIDSKRKDQTQEEHDKAINKIINYIEEKRDLNWLLYISGKDWKKNNCKADLTLEEASKIDSIYDVIIFKVGASTGWDIPRANMLVQLRSVSSEMLNIQTLGRIKRNPYPNLEFNEIVDKYYVYTDYQEKTRTLEGYHLKEKFQDIKMYSGELKIQREAIEEEYLKNIKKFLKDERQHISEAKESGSKKTLEYNIQTFRGAIRIATIPQKIGSSIKLKLWVLKFLKDNKSLFPTTLLRWIKEFSLKNSIDYEIYLFTIRDIVQSLKQIYNKAYSTHRKNDEYSIKSSVSPMEYYQIWNNKDSKNFLDVTNFEEYGYKLVLDIDKKDENLQYLDSFPEVEAMNKIIDRIDSKYCKNKTKFFAKMPTLGSNIFFEYFSKEDSDVHKSFIDFAIVDINDNVLMIEVKGHDDYDKDKTSSLINSYSEYMKANSNKRIKIALIYAGKKNGKVQRPYSYLWDSIQKKFINASIGDMIDEFFGR